MCSRFARHSMPAVALLATLWIAVPAAAIGYWNVPGSFCQCFGGGWGAGHHAPLVLGPVSCRGCCSTNEVRLRHAPAPPHAYYGHVGYGGCDRYLDEPSWLQSPALPAATAALAPTTPIFGPPVEP